jgi:hypothetical protein
MDSEKKINSEFVSIVLTYKDRWLQLKNTLDSFSYHNYYNFEVIIIDDGSVLEPLNTSLFCNYDFIIKLTILTNNNKYYNPCIPFNIGFSNCYGEKIIIQNSECLHLDNILDHVRKNLDDSSYMTYTCYSLEKELTLSLFNKDKIYINKFLKNTIIESRKKSELNFTNWKNHIIFRPNSLHFTSAITKKNLQELGGFDERYANGTSYDDDEFLTRILRKGLNVTIVENIKSVHQWHTNTENYKKLFSYYLRSKNYILFKFVTKNEQLINPSNKSFLFFLYKITLSITVPINILFIHIRLLKNKLK